ncbi:AEC family transporter [Spirulina sp. CS-785/01]|uniref:AEC family transporter n=1 Tax=Spirulina sp. CS-785/01 TaxID=3021716 RepID=UPI00232B015A|nr:AEC family transporter [Spirulina sp. CS-785/01]MDB9311562.1 AEC family transporter [Spirulina sp. CS-785/01]
MSSLLELYLKLLSGVFLGLILGRFLSYRVPQKLGEFLFWVGVPLGVIVFLRRADLSGAVWFSPVIAWVATLLGAGLAWLWIHWKTPHWTRPFQGSFMFASMFGNTGYLGYPVILTLVGEKYFGYALFYDLFCTTLGAYGLGGMIAAIFGQEKQASRPPFWTIFKQPIWWAFAFGLWFRQFQFSPPVEATLQGVGWFVVSLSLVLIGMRLSYLKALGNWRSASVSLGIKMLLVPLLFGVILGQVGMTGGVLLVFVLQIAMPPAFATLVVAETYDLDRELAVTAIAMGSLSLLILLPVWMVLFG